MGCSETPWNRVKSNKFFVQHIRTKVRNKSDNIGKNVDGWHKFVEFLFDAYKPSPIPLFSNTPHENHIALERFNAVSSFPVWAILYRPNGENRSNKYKMTATTWTDRRTSNHNSALNGRRKESRLLLLVFLRTKIVIPGKNYDRSMQRMVSFRNYNVIIFF